MRKSPIAFLPPLVFVILVVLIALASVACATVICDLLWSDSTGWKLTFISAGVFLLISSVLLIFRAEPRPAAPSRPPKGPPSLPFRGTRGIVSDDTDPTVDADVIMTATILGFAAAWIARTGTPIRFDMDPDDLWREDGDRSKVEPFHLAVEKIHQAIRTYLEQCGILDAGVESGAAPDYEKGAVIMGVYALAGQRFPEKVKSPEISAKGRRLYNQIKEERIHQYTGKGAYTGFVDNPNGKPIGPRPTACFCAPAPGTIAPDSHPRWLPPFSSSSPLWGKRKRFCPDPGHSPASYVPWGLIGGDVAYKAPDRNLPNPRHASNAADQVIGGMQAAGMVFNDEVTIHDIAAYTHGMIQAIYEAYGVGPGCTPYEIAVGKATRKLASCIPCTLFMVSLGYEPTSIHLGRGESWAPLYKPYKPGSGRFSPQENTVVQSLNSTWYENCLKWLIVGLDILTSRDILKDEQHRASVLAVEDYLNQHASKAFTPPGKSWELDIRKLDLKRRLVAFMKADVNTTVPDYTVGGALILDALTIHDTEQARIHRTLKDLS